MIVEWVVDDYGRFPVYCYGVLMALWCLISEWIVIDECNYDDSSTGIINLLIGAIGGVVATVLLLIGYEIAKVVVPWLLAICIIIAICCCL